ncbi:diaminopimelate epimerase [Roseicyclus persicicus]|uniref:Diaminopimelate epimerase n=1 Tax=Roseicyclus persicicus TaxID=2650661 RepID=A0A7X6GYS7_9RHOB|nr:diaminopimelate epimerase [Roseibacterium persicicum]NKX44885.1 diaminopimelate epimerase [Roseibacterium persicicum]
MSQTVPPPGLPFMKMHGLGNDFVVIDARDGAAAVTAGLARGLADRHRGVGFDQLAVIEEDAGADLRLTFFNADGSLSAACGNATRCIARWEMDRRGIAALTLRTERGVLQARDAGGGLTSVNMGPPVTDWAGIPLAREMDTLHLPIDGDPVATGMGNPHCTFFVADAEAVDLAADGARMEHHPLFPERTNVQFAHVMGPGHLRMRVWERGTGITLASGSSSCAVAVAAARRGLTGRSVRITLDGGEIGIDWREDGVWMTGPTAHVFSGVLTPEWLGAV